MPQWVYISGPYTGGDTVINVRNAITAGMQVQAMGCVPIIPHLSHFMHLIYPRRYEFWMDVDLEMLERCDALLRLPGESPGADREVVRAEELGLPVIYPVATYTLAMDDVVAEYIFDLRKQASDE